MPRPAASLLALLILAAAPAAAAQQQGPGFDCRKARSATEKLICADGRLAALDRRLSDVFRELRQTGSDERKAELLKDQQRWLREVRDRCVGAAGPGEAAVACLSAGYRIRIGELAGPARLTAPAEESGGEPDPRRTLVRIQSALEHVAAGMAPGAVGPDPLEAIVPAYAAFRAGDLAGMDTRLAAISAEAAGRVEALNEANAGDAPWAGLLREYFADLRTAAADPAPLTRLAAALRQADGVLFIESARPTETLAYPKERSVAGGMAPSPLDGARLKLPCRTLIGQAEPFAAVAARLGEGPADLISCPAATGSFAEVEALARDPAGFPPAAPAPAPPPPAKANPAGVAPPPPWDRETAIARMAERPELAAPVLEAASREDALGALDYALFLYAFRSDGAERDAAVAGLLNRILDLPSDEPERPQPIPADGSPDPAQLIEILRYASVSSLANSDSAFYAIPCAVLLARPELLEAIEPYYGGNRDNFLPRSGCGWGRGEVRGFPEREVRDYIRASEAADGGFIANFDGTMRYALMAGVEATLQAIAVDPRSFLEQPEPAPDHPYQTWGATGLTAHHVSLEIRQAYGRASERLVAFMTGRGMSAPDAARGAKAALFALVFGAECGGTAPGESTRALILAGAAAGAVIPRLDLPDEGESPSVVACAATAGLEPLAHVAVVDPTLLEHLLLRGDEVDAPNDFGKTPLMVAAQYDRLDAARLLLSHGAAVNAITWQGSDIFEVTLRHDARTPLMYAAANASLPMIKLLLDAGADPYRADSKGRRAIDYLLGFGPTAANTKLSPAEQSEAARLLY